jgi:hypothetical protein
MDARPVPDVYDDELWEFAAAYRVTLWERPAVPPDIEKRLGYRLALRCGWGGNR